MKANDLSTSSQATVINIIPDPKSDIKTKEQKETAKQNKTDKPKNKKKMDKEGFAKALSKAQEKNAKATKATETTPDNVDKIITTSNMVIDHKQEVMDKSRYQLLTTRIFDNIKSAEKSFLTIACSLYEIHRDKLYRLQNHDNIYDYAKDKFGIARGTCNGYINIMDKFGKRNDNGSVDSAIDSKYKDFSMSALLIMCSIPQVHWIDCTPDMSVRDLKALAKSLATQNIADSKQDSSGFIPITDEEIPDAFKDPKPEAYGETYGDSGSDDGILVPSQKLLCTVCDTDHLNECLEYLKKMLIFGKTLKIYEVC